jgi:hypothetical protein
MIARRSATDCPAKNGPFRKELLLQESRRKYFSTPWGSGRRWSLFLLPGRNRFGSSRISYMRRTALSPDTPEVRPRAPDAYHAGALSFARIDKNLGEAGTADGHRLGHRLSSSQSTRQCKGTTKTNSPDNSTSAGIEQERNGRREENFKTGP